MKNILSQRYYHELDSRERIFSRLQLNFAIYASVIALLSYMVRMIDYSSSCVVIIIFFAGIVAGVALLIASIRYTVIALTGYEYKTLEKSKDLIRYAEQCKQYSESLNEYKFMYNTEDEISDPEVELNEYICDAFSECIDHNYAINEFRRLAVKKSIWHLVIASIPVIASAFLFVTFDLDASSPRKVSISFDNEKPLINAINRIQRSLSVISTTTTEKEMAAMPNEENKPNNAQQQNVTPPPPPPKPERPKLQVSTENYKEHLPERARLLNEDKK